MKPTITMKQAREMGYQFDGSYNVKPDPEMFAPAPKGDASFGTVTSFEEPSDSVKEEE